MGMTKAEQQRRQAMLDKIFKQIDDEIHSWADLFDEFKTKMNEWHATGNPMLGHDALLSMYSFILTLEEFPDEGDAVQIAKKMATLAIMQPERLGADTTVITREDAAKVAEYEALEEQRLAMEQGEEDEDDEGQSGDHFYDRSRTRQIH